MYTATHQGTTDLQITEGLESGSRVVRVTYGVWGAEVVVPAYVASRWGTGSAIREALALVHRAQADQMVSDMFAACKEKAERELKGTSCED